MLHLDPFGCTNPFFEGGVKKRNSGSTLSKAGV